MLRIIGTGVNEFPPALLRFRELFAAVRDVFAASTRSTRSWSPGQPSLERSKSAAQERETSRSMMSRAEAIQQPDSRGSTGRGIGRI